jgi:hypothetical protein
LVNARAYEFIPIIIEKTCQKSIIPLGVTLGVWRGEFFTIALGEAPKVHAYKFAGVIKSQARNNDKIEMEKVSLK